MASHNIHDKTVVSEREAKAFKDALLAHAKLPENRVCSDCPKTGPTWCSVNLGVLICMDCAGGHRNLGVHLSKVRSLTLDTMTASQFRFLKAMDNVRANSYWEANMPPDYVKTEANRAATLNNKYKFKKWVDTTIKEPSLDTFPDHPWFKDASQSSPQPPSAQPEDAPASQPRAAPPPSQPAASVSRPVVTPQAAEFDLLGGFDADVAPQPVVASSNLVQHNRALSAPESSSAVDLLGSVAPQPATNVDTTFDDFASLSVSSGPAPAPQASSCPADPFAASHVITQAPPTPVPSQPVATAVPQVQAAALAAAPAAAWPVTSTNTDVSWPGMSNAAPAVQPQVPAATKVKKSAAEIAAQVQSLYQQPSPGFNQHARSASVGAAPYGAGPSPGQLQSQPMPPMHMAQKGFPPPAASHGMMTSWSTPTFQPTQPYAHAMPAPPYANPNANGFSNAPMPTAGQPPLGGVNHAFVPHQPQPQWP